jgi:hypothetical protein
LSGSILLLAYQRPEVLVKSILSLEKARRVNISDLTVVFQEGDSSVNSQLEGIDWITKRIFRTSYPANNSSAKSINSNIHLGLTESFNNPNCDYVVVIEDDICVSVDFFEFVYSVYSQNNTNKKFRGINGFSGIPRQLTSCENYGKYRYGVGWGWVLTRESWNSVQRFWTGNEEEHWDGLVEPYFRSGYIVAPGMSRIQNLGFGNSATHTRSENDLEVAKVEQRLTDSFVGDAAQVESKVGFRLAQQDLNWRADCFQFISLRRFDGLLIQMLFSSAYFLETRFLRHLKVARLVAGSRALTIRAAHRLSG